VADTIIIPTQGHACLYYSFIGTPEGQIQSVFTMRSIHIQWKIYAPQYCDFLWWNSFFFLLIKDIFAFLCVKFCNDCAIFIVDSSMIDKHNDIVSW